MKLCPFVERCDVVNSVRPRDSAAAESQTKVYQKIDEIIKIHFFEKS
jgi:hypothetical protein